VAVAEVNVQYYSPEAVEEPLIAFSLLSNILCQILPRALVRIPLGDGELSTTLKATVSPSIT